MPYVFGDYMLDTQRHEIWDAHGVIPLERQVLRVLTYLLDHADRLVTRQELFDRLWPGLSLYGPCRGVYGPQQRSVSATLSPLPASSRRNPGNCGWR
jgi:hypothetical protein